MYSLWSTRMVVHALANRIHVQSLLIPHCVIVPEVSLETGLFIYLVTIVLLWLLLEEVILHSTNNEISSRAPSTGMMAPALVLPGGDCSRYHQTVTHHNYVWQWLSCGFVFTIITIIYAQYGQVCSNLGCCDSTSTR